MPPWFPYMMIGNNDSMAPREKTCTEGMDQKIRSIATCHELCHPLLVDFWLACRVYYHLERPSRLFVQKFNRNMEQANARSILVNNGLWDFAFVFQQRDTILCVQKLLLQEIGIPTIRDARFLVKAFRSCL